MSLDHFRTIHATRLRESIEAKQALLADEAAMAMAARITEAVCDCLDAAPGKGGTVFFAGNGGSFADAIHLAAELVARFRIDRPALAAIALGANNSVLTAVGNDYSFEDVLVRELRALARPGDVFIGLSTSGNSPNVVRCVTACNELGVTPFCLTGAGGGKLAALCDCLMVPEAVTARIQEAHITVGHVLCELVEAHFFGTAAEDS